MLVIRPPRTRASSSGGNGVNTQVSGADGIYLNETFMHRVTSLIGLEVEISTHSKEMYSGILRTFSSNFDVVLELPHRTDPPPSSQTVGLQIIADKMIFKFDSIVKITAHDTDLDSMTRNTFQTDTTISKYNGQPLGEKVLEMWEPPTINGDLEEFDLNSGSSNINGWDADDMFRRNEQEHGVTSTFDQNLSGYTTELRTDMSNFKNEEAKAARLAREIESNPSSQNRANLENGDEEERFAAVSRSTNDVSNNHNDSKYSSGRRKPGSQQSANAYGLFNRNRKHPEKYPNNASNERWECVTSSGTKNSNQNRSHNHQQNGNSNTVNKSTGSTYHNNANQSYSSSNSREPSVNGQTDKRSSASTSNRRDTPQSSSNSRHATGRNNYNSNDNQSLPSSSRTSPTTVQGHNQTSNVASSRYQTSTYTQQTNTTNTRTNISTSYAAAADKPMTKAQPPPPPIRVRDESLTSELKKFSTDFNLSTAPTQSDLRVSSPGIPTVSENSKQHSAQISHSEPSQSSQEVPQLPKVTESPSSQQVYKSQPEGQVENNTDSVKKDSNEISSEENSSQSSDKIVIQTSKLNPNAKEFVFNPNTKPFIPRSPSTPNSSRPMTPQTPTTNIVATSGSHQQMIQAQHGPAIAIPAAYHHHHHHTAPGSGPMVTHQPPPHPHPAFTMLPTVFVTSNSAFNHHPHSMPPQPPNQAGRFRKMTVGMSHRGDIASQIQVAAATGQPLLAPAPIQAQFAVPGYSPQPMPTPQAYQQVQMVRMVPQQGGGMMPALVPTSISYHPTNAGQIGQMDNGVPQGPPYHHHHHHQASQHHMMNQQQNAQSPAPQPVPPQTPGQSQTPVNFQQPPPQQSQPPPFPAGTTIMCPILPTPTGSQQPPAPNTPGSAPSMQPPPPQQQHPQQYISHPHPHHQTTPAPTQHGQYHIYSTIRES
ncbi:ataxin-2 homolog isoform X2 [Daktulosphaira vitifoliae]|uniref:ataxin-2 homolog isoform X2 n=1 Tax=Daktulosphaira vitifoliae TaxID=58002 RepID=UPI0021AAA13B|nr:ataxin-2 homolog isoform X2 [Daktulosphaira vitifoliae]